MKVRLLGVLVVGLTFFIPWAYGWSYPLKEVEGAFCGQSGGTCTIELPRIFKADYLSYDHLPRYRQIYTVMWWGTYFWGRDFGLGSHQGVDIASVLGTPILSAGDGEVIFAKEKWERGKLVIIKHLWKGQTLHTVYAHLERILVKVGDHLKEGDLIASMGASGNATGPHLHFQIDTNEGEHPYFPKGCGGTLAELVNEARCWSQVKTNTLDPILFLETQGKIFLAERQWEQHQTSPSVFMAPHQVEILLETPVLMIGETTNLWIRPKISQSDAFLREEFRFISKSPLEVFPTKISYLGEGRAISVFPKTRGLHQIEIWSGERLLRRLSLFVLDEDLLATLRARAGAHPVLEPFLKDKETLVTTKGSPEKVPLYL